MEENEYSSMNHQENNHWWFQALHNIPLEFLHKKNISNIRLLDAGCGTGGFLNRLSHEFSNIKITGFDNTQLALNFANKKLSCSLLRNNINQLPLCSESFDIITCHDVLYHKTVNIENAIEEIRRILKKSGYLLVNLPAFNFIFSDHDKKVHTQKRFTKKDLPFLFPEEHWVIQKQFYWNSILFPLIIIFRFAKKFKLLPHFGSDVNITHPLLNKVLSRVLKFETKYLRNISFMPGLSLYCIVQKKY